MSEWLDLVIFFTGIAMILATLWVLEDPPILSDKEIIEQAKEGSGMITKEETEIIERLYLMAVCHAVCYSISNNYSGMHPAHLEILKNAEDVIEGNQAKEK